MATYRINLHTIEQHQYFLLNDVLINTEKFYINFITDLCLECGVQVLDKVDFEIIGKDLINYPTIVLYGHPKNNVLGWIPLYLIKAKNGYGLNKFQEKLNEIAVVTIR